MIPPKLTESDVEHRVVWRLLTDASYLGIDETRIRAKVYLEPTVLDKKAGKSAGYIPDYAIYVNSLPIMIVEAKSPNVEPEVGYRESSLYAFHLNKQFKPGLNPCQRILASNGIRVVAGFWDAEPILDYLVSEIVPGSSALAKLREHCGGEILTVAYKILSPKLQPKAFIIPADSCGGENLLKAAMSPNTFAAPLSPILKRYFSSKQQNNDPEIYRDGYIDSSVNSNYDDILDNLMRERIVEARGSLSSTLSPTKRREKNIAQAISLFADSRPNGDLQLITGGVGTGKSLFIRRYKELLQSPADKEVTHWAFVDFVSAPKNLVGAENWICDRFIESFTVENGYDAYDAYNWDHVFAVELSRRKGIYDDIAASSEAQAKMVRANDLNGWIDDPQRTAKGICRYFIGDRRETIVVVMDNVDKLTKDDQLAVFQLSLWFMEFTRAFIILNLRDDTYERYKNEPPLDTYRSGVSFHVKPPKFIDVVRRRLELSVAFLKTELRDTLEYSTANGIRVTYPKERVGEFIREIYSEVFDHHKNIGRLIQGLAGRDVRHALEIFEQLMRSGHLSEEAITRKAQHGGAVEIGESAVLKTLMRGEYKFYSERSGFVANLFYTGESWERPNHYLISDLLFWLYSKRKIPGQLGLEGYFSVAFVARELELSGYPKIDVISAVNYCLGRSLLEADHFGRTILSEGDNIKIGYSGFIHLRFLSDRLEYIYGVLATTPIFNAQAANAVTLILQREAKFGEVPIELKAQAVGAFFGTLREEYTNNVSSYPAFGGAGTGASYIIDSVERALKDVRDKRVISSKNILDEI